jgi:hypothetical protein
MATATALLRSFRRRDIASASISAYRSVTSLNSSMFFLFSVWCLLAFSYFIIVGLVSILIQVYYSLEIFLVCFEHLSISLLLLFILWLGLFEKFGLYLVSQLIF